MIEAILHYDFLQNAVISAFFTSIVCGIIGSIVIEKKLVMMSGGIAHTSFGGIGLGYYLGIEPIITALIFSIISSLTIVRIKHTTNTDSDTLIGIFWSIGMALGILFISLTPGYPPNMSTYLFGDILTVSNSDIILIIILTTIVVGTIISFYNYWKGYLFDQEFMAVLGINIDFLEYFLFILIALTIVMLIRIVGIILIIALLTAPAAIARLYTSDLKKMMLGAVVVSIIFSFSGLIISYQFNIASGASIILLSGITYLILAFSRRHII